MTGQDQFGGYDDAGIVIAVDLVNGLTVDHAFGRPVARVDPFAAIQKVLEIDPPSAAQLRDRDVPSFIALAERLRDVFGDLDGGDLDVAAGRLNDLLAKHPAHPHLAKDDGHWRLHHHPVDAALVPMATAVCAEGIARMIGTDAGSRFGRCAGSDCDRVFLDTSKNGSRRFCSTTCQNRVKAAAFRRRQAASRR